MPLKNKSTPRLLGLGLALFCLQSASAQNTVPVQGAVSAAVVQATPIVVYDDLPHEECIDLPQQRQHCRTTYVQQERVQGYEVTYTYQGKNYTTELAYDPGATVLILPPQSQRSYSSQPGAHGAAIQPGRKSYGSAPPGAQTHSIEYRSPQPDIPIVVDLHAPLGYTPGLPSRPPMPPDASPSHRPPPPSGYAPRLPGH